MKVKIEKSLARGEVYAPPSKSASHRLLIAAALADGTSRIDGISLCDDVLATADCLRALGAKIEFSGDSAAVTGCDVTRAIPSGTLNCRESGSTLRFMIPIAAMCGDKVSFSAAEGLLKRPLSVYEELFAQRGISLTRAGGLIEVCGRLGGGDYTLRGDVSSQFISGLLFSAPLTGEDVRIRITERIESRPYIDMTLSAMRICGITAVWESESTIFVKGGQAYHACNRRVEGDWSGSAFTESFNLFGGDVHLLGLCDDSLQGDRIYREHFKALERGAPTISLSDCPDLGPILFAVAAAKNGARFTNTSRLKIKESDRAEMMAQELRKLGARIEVEENCVTVYKSELHAPSEPLLGHNDHRIVMSLATLASVYGGEIIGAEAVKKSYPNYFEDIKSLGINVTEYEN